MAERPDPDELLRRIALDEQRQKRGKFTIFFGAAPGVGKTYAMLEAARAERVGGGRDVVVGVVETHGRFETGALMLGFELLPKRRVLYRSVEIEEFDLDAALARKPSLILVDELAHTNAEGSRHPKRWQDVEELLDAGIDVYSTLNVQHVESLNDVIAKITGVMVRETVPDSALESADELKLVDLPPDDLLERLREGKVYVPAQAQRAIENFFRKGNLIALRELALRRTAERVDAQMQEYRKAQGIEQTWAVAEQILVAVSPSPYSARLVRAARRMAAALHAHWYAVYVEPPRALALAPSAEQRLAQNLRLAEQLGAEVHTLSGENATEELLRFARERNITKIIVGKPVVIRWRDRFRRSLVDEMMRRSGDIDVYATAGDLAPEERVPEQRPFPTPSLPSWGVAAGAALVATALAWLLFDRDQLPDVVMTYLLGIVLVASRFGLAASALATFLSVAALDFIFIPPYFTFDVEDLRHSTMFVVMFFVAIVISGLTERVRNQAVAARQRERRATALYDLSAELAAARGGREVIEIAAGQIEKVFESTVLVFTPDSSGTLQRLYASVTVGAASERADAIAQWVWANRQEAGLGTTSLPSSPALYLPLMASGAVVGVLGVTPERPERFRPIDQRRQLDTFATQLALAMERARLAEATESAQREVEKEQLRSSLLSAVSHDLRTPLAVITGSASTLIENRAALDDTARSELTKTILQEAERLSRLIRNLLDMTRLDSGAIHVKSEWIPLEEVVGAALHRIDPQLAGRDVQVELPPDLPLVACDPVLLEQALVHLLENAAKYGAGPIELCARVLAEDVLVEVDDRGPGIAEGQETQIFDKFFRGVPDGSRGGVGLGLSICRAIVAGHGGRIWAQNRPGGGASFRFTLPRGAASMLGRPEPLPPNPAEPSA